MKAGKLFIGRNHPNKTPYTVTFSGKRATLVKVENDTVDGQVMTESEEVVLEK